MPKPSQNLIVSLVLNMWCEIGISEIFCNLSRQCETVELSTFRVSKPTALLGTLYQVNWMNRERLTLCF